MKTKTLKLIEEIEQTIQQPSPSNSPISSPTLQPQAEVQPEQSNQNPPLNIEVYIPLHNGSFTNRIFSTSKNVTVKVLNDDIETDINTMLELENNPDSYFQIKEK